MSLVTNTNVPALIAQRRLSLNTQQYQKSLQRLASGQRINRAADDAAGLTISQNLIGQVRRMEQAQRNTQDGIGVLQIVEGALSVISDNLQRIRELTVQAANDNYDVNSRNAIADEIKSRLNDVDRIANSTQFNGLGLLDGSLIPPPPLTPYVPLQIGPNSDTATNVMDISPLVGTATSTALGILDPFNIPSTTTFPDINSIQFGSNATAQSFLMDIDNGINAVTRRRSMVGSYQNQLESAVSNLATSIENFQVSNSQIRDVDIAKETATKTQYEILQEASVHVLAQTNRIPQMILGLLQQAR